MVMFIFFFFSTRSIFLWKFVPKIKTVEAEIENLQSFSYFETFNVLLNFFSSQVKWCVIITYKHGIYEFPHELPNDLRLMVLEN